MTPPSKGPLRLLAAPILFAAYPVAALYAHNYHEVDLPDLLLPIGVIFLAMAILFFVVMLLFRDLAKSSASVAAFLIFSFAYSSAFDGTRTVAASLGAGHLVTNKLFFSVWCLAFLGWGIAILRSRHVSLMLRILRIAGVVLLLSYLFRVLARALGSGRPDAQAASENPDGPPFLLSLPDPAPDVYYLVFDRYASASNLKESFSFDNTPFTDSLRTLGFVVDDAAITNYPMTHTSLASSL